MSADMRAMVLDTPRLPLAMRERRACQSLRPARSSS